MDRGISPIQKYILVRRFIESIPDLDTDINNVDECLKTIPKNYLEKEMKELIQNGILDKNGDITGRGRHLIRVGVIGGVFDLLHIGHVNILKKAKKYVDVLIVIIATDDTVRKMKNREPLHKQEWRREVMSSLRYVDAAIIGEEKEFKIPLLKIDPDVIFLGYDQKIPPGISKDEIKNREVVKLNFKIEGVKTSKIIEKLDLL